MLDIKDAVALGLGAALLAACAGLATAWVSLSNERATSAALRTQIADIKGDAARTLAAETQKTRQLESALRTAHDQQENKDAQHAEIVAAKDLELRRRTRAGGGPGLRDPYAAACPNGNGGSSAPPTATAAADRADDGAEAGRLLSLELEQFLVTQAEAADRINVAYASCRGDAETIRAMKDPQ